MATVAIVPITIIVAGATGISARPSILKRGLWPAKLVLVPAMAGHAHVTWPPIMRGSLTSHRLRLSYWYMTPAGWWKTV